jgi:hypothetical protein
MNTTIADLDAPWKATAGRSRTRAMEAFMDISRCRSRCSPYPDKLTLDAAFVPPLMTEPQHCTDGNQRQYARLGNDC